MLFGADGLPLDKGIPFYWVRPDLPLVIKKIERPSQTAVLAWRFIAQGGRYMIAIIDENTVRLAAMVGGSGVDGLVLQEIQCRNGPELLQAVDGLVKNSNTALDDAQ